MNRNLVLTFIMVILAGGSAVAAYATPWLCTLPESIELATNTVTLGDISQTPVPASAARIVLATDGIPGTTMVLARKMILRLLVNGHLAAGVSFRGAESCLITFQGTVMSEAGIRSILQQKLDALLPETEPGAPETWLELEYRQGDLGVHGRYDFLPMITGVLRPGRQQVRFRFQDGSRNRVLPVNVIVHHYGEVAHAAHRIVHGATLSPGDFVWEWMDLVNGAQGCLVGRSLLAGKNAARTMETGSVLREQDLKIPPIILAGDPVELKLTRGNVMVSVRAFARREGVLGQTIPVRNEMTGKLVNARIVGPGQVEWRY